MMAVARCFTRGPKGPVKIAAFLLLVLSTTFAAAYNQEPNTVPNAKSEFLRININASTTNIIEGSLYGVDAELINVSNLPIDVDLQQVRLTVQPELAPGGWSCTYSYYAYYANNISKPRLQPGDHFTVFFDTGAKLDAQSPKDSPVCKSTWLDRLRRPLDFVPGKYAFVINVPFSPILQVPGNSAPADPPVHYYTETANLPVTIDQAEMVIYAGLGGVLAFLVMTFRVGNTLVGYATKVQASSQQPPRKVWIIVRGMGGAILLSATVAVIAGRLSNTEFPVKVSINDFWGALTVGFVSYFFGGKFIDKLSDLAGKPGAPQKPSAAD